MAKEKKTQILKYRVVVEKEAYEDGRAVYVSHVPTLGISDYGDGLEETLKNTEALIKFHVESLIEEGEAVPSPDDPGNIIVTTSEVKIEPKKKFALA